jgi:hypothetical protein
VGSEMCIRDSRKDPANLSRCKVRIIGWHDENENLAPIEDLPWAQVLMPVNNSRNISLPKEGEWVSGYFLDGMNAQLPVIMGVYPGLVPKDPNVATSLPWHDERPQSEINRDPKPPTEVIIYKAGEPTVPRPGRGVLDGTMIAKNNKQIAHVCDFVSEMQKNINLKKYTKALAEQIRKAIRAVLKALGFTDATGQFSWILNTLKAYAREVRRIQKEIIQPIIDFEKYVLAYITKIRAMIQWLLSLPQRFLELLNECLQKFLQLIRQIFIDTITGFKEGIKMDEVDEVIKSAKDAVNATYDLANKTLTAVAGAQQIVSAATTGLLIPTSDADVEAADKYITNYTSSSNNAISSVNAGKQAP